MGATVGLQVSPSTISFTLTVASDGAAFARMIVRLFGTA